MRKGSVIFYNPTLVPFKCWSANTTSIVLDDKIYTQQNPVQCHYELLYENYFQISDFPLLQNLVLYFPDFKLDVTELAIGLAAAMVISSNS